MVGGVADPPPDVVEKLARAAGAEVWGEKQQKTEMSNSWIISVCIFTFSLNCT